MKENVSGCFFEHSVEPKKWKDHHGQKGKKLTVTKSINK